IGLFMSMLSSLQKHSGILKGFPIFALTEDSKVFCSLFIYPNRKLRLCLKYLSWICAIERQLLGSSLSVSIPGSDNILYCEEFVGSVATITNPSLLVGSFS